MLSLIRISRIDHYEIRPKVRLKLRELGMHHHNHILVERQTGVEFLATGFRQTGADDPQNDFGPMELSACLRIKKCRDALTGVGWRHVYGQAVHRAQCLKAKRRDLIFDIPI